MYRRTRRSGQSEGVGGGGVQGVRQGGQGGQVVGTKRRRPWRK